MKIQLIICVHLFLFQFISGQDIIYMISGMEIQAKVLSITDGLVTYKKFDNINGPDFQIRKKDVFMIKYENGTKDVFGMDNEISSDVINMNSKDLCERAVNDATKNYKPMGPMIGTYIPSMLVMPVGLVTAAIVAPATPKAENLNIYDPNLLKNEAYMKCYIEQSKKIKKKKTWMAFFSGWAAGMAIVAISLSAN